MGELTDLSRRPSLKRVEISRVNGSVEATDNNVVVTDDVVATEEPLEIRLELDGNDGKRFERSIVGRFGADEFAGFILVEHAILVRKVMPLQLLHVVFEISHLTVFEGDIYIAAGASA